MRYAAGPHLPGEVQQLEVLSPLIGGIRKYRHITLLIFSFLAVLHYSFTLRICQCLFARLVMNLIKREDNDWKIPAPLHHLPGVNIEVNYGLELPHTHISRNNYKNKEQSRGVSGPLLTLLWSMATVCCLCYIPFHFHYVFLRMFLRRSQNFRKTKS